MRPAGGSPATGAIGLVLVAAVAVLVAGPHHDRVPALVVLAAVLALIAHRLLTGPRG